MIRSTARRSGNAVLLVALLGLTGCSDKLLKEKQDYLDKVRLGLRLESVKPWYGARWNDPEPVEVKVTLRNETPYIVDVLNRFIPSRATDPGMLSPLTVVLTDRKTGKRFHIERFEEPERPTWKEFKTLDPNGSVSAVFDLRESFPELRQPGQYQVEAWYQFGDKEAEAVREGDEFKKGWFWTGRQQVWPWSGRIEAKPLIVTLKRVAEPPPPKPVPSPSHGEGGHGGHGESGHGEATHGAAAEQPAAHGASAKPPEGEAKPAAHGDASKPAAAAQPAAHGETKPATHGETKPAAEAAKPAAHGGEGQHK